jgi:hypothetical protein
MHAVMVRAAEPCGQLSTIVARDARHPEIRLALARRDPYIGIVQCSNPLWEMTMTTGTSILSATAPTVPSLSTADLFRRIDEMPMSVHDRERAKATLRTAESIAEGLGLVVTAMRSLIARIAPASTPRSTLRNSPAPR